MTLHTKYQGSRPCGFRQEDFFMFLPIKAYVKPLTPKAGKFWPKGYYLNKLAKGSLDDTTYQKSRLYALWFQTSRLFHVAPYISLCKHVTQGPSHFWPQSYNLNKLGTSLLDDTTYQISRLYSLWFQTRRFFHVAPYKSLYKTCDPHGGPIFCLRAII